MKTTEYIDARRVNINGRQASIAVYGRDGQPVASLPAWLNGHRIPTLSEARRLCA